MLDPELTSRYWTVRKVIAIIGYFGGLRNIELRSIEFGKTFGGGEKSFDMDQSGYWFTIERGKQRGLPVVSAFCVPRRQEDWKPPVSGRDRNPVDYDPASVIDHYLSLLEVDLNCTRDKLSGSFFKSAHGENGRFFRNVPMGKNLIEKVGCQFAEELLLPHPATFTSHCWRRSCGTNASDAGVNVTTLMAHLGWSTPKTAIGYVQKSRQTSYNVSMFLSNVQRENTDLDKVLDLLKPLLVKSDSKKVSKKNCSSNAKRAKTVKIVKPVPVVDERLVAKFSNHLASARRGESRARTREQKSVEAKNFKIVRSINESGLDGPQESEAVSGSLEDFGGGGSEYGDIESGSVVGSGGGGSIVGGGGDSVVGGGGESVHLNALDPRVASILSNLQNHGQLHVHFHFGSK